MKAYIPNLKNGEELIHSTKNPDLFRGMSIDGDNNRDFPEMKEIDLDDYISKESAYEMEMRIRQEIYAKLNEENNDRENQYSQTENTDFSSAVGGAVVIVGIIAGISAYVATHPEILDTAKAKATDAVNNVKGFFSKVKSKWDNRPELMYISGVGIVVGKRKQSTESISVVEDKIEDKTQREDMSLEDAQVLLLNTLAHYIGFKKGAERLSNVTVNGKDVNILDIEKVLELTDDLAKKYPMLIDEKTKPEVLAALELNNDIEENTKIAELLGIELENK